MSDVKEITDDLSVEVDPQETALRWMPMAVVTVAVSGFFTLAWYAYHAGTQSIREEDLMLVEADNTPMKEAPQDPGGMKFPNQDKTVYETFGGEPIAKPVVEKILPAPEEPMDQPAGASETKTWVNDKLHNRDNTEEALPPAPAAMEKAAPAAGGAEPVKKAESAPAPAVEKKPAVPEAAKPETPVAGKERPAPEPAKAETPDSPPRKAEKAADRGGSSRIQLGAYRSEAEAHAAWEKIAKAQGSLLAGREPSVQKADLGEKGIYYRLQVGGFASPAATKDLCAKLSGGHQACIPVK